MYDKFIYFTINMWTNMVNSLVNSRAFQFCSNFNLPIVLILSWGEFYGSVLGKFIYK